MPTTTGHSLRCAFCHDALGRVAVTCADCRTLVHAECQTEVCPTLGCASELDWTWWRAPLERHPGTEWLAGGVGALVGLVLALSLLPYLAKLRSPAPGRPELYRESGTGCPPIASFGVFEQRGRGISGRTAWTAGCRPHTKSRTTYRSEGWRRRETVSEPEAYAPISHANCHGPHQPGEDTPRVVVEIRVGVELILPAGALRTRYERRVGREAGCVAVQETWTHPDFPFPVKELVRWRHPGHPELPECFEERVLCAAAR